MAEGVDCSKFILLFINVTTLSMIRLVMLELVSIKVGMTLLG